MTALQQQHQFEFLFLVNAVCCSVWQGVAVCCRVLQCVAVCCSVLQCVAACEKCVGVCCSHGAAGMLVSISVPLEGSMVQCVAVCCSVLQCVAVCCNV